MTEVDFDKKLKQALDKQLEAIDVNTQVKLNEFRHEAIYQQNNGYLTPFRKVALGLGLTAVFAISLMLIYPTQNSTTAAEAFIFEDLELLSNEADTEFYQDIEFLTWLDENQLIETGI